QEGLKPPTNRWFSSLVFGKEPATVFAYPLSFRAYGDRFELSVPKISSNQDVVTAPHLQDITVKLESDSYEVSRYDDLSVTVRYFNGDRSTAEVTLAEGSPFVFLRANEQTVVEVTFRTASSTSSRSAESRLLRVDGQRYGVFAEDIDETNQRSMKLLVPKSRYDALFAVPNNATAIDAYI